MYTKLDISFLGLKVQKVGIMIIQDLDQVLDKKHQTTMPGIVGWDLIWLSCYVFVQKYGALGLDPFES